MLAEADDADRLHARARSRAGQVKDRGVTAPPHAMPSQSDVLISTPSETFCRVEAVGIVVAGGECVVEHLVKFAQRVGTLLRLAPPALLGGVGDGAGPTFDRIIDAEPKAN